VSSAAEGGYRRAVEFSDRDVVNGLTHLYRGELGRMTTYRVRLDTTTNWAVGTTAATTTLALGSAAIPHFVFGIPFILVLLFLWMEATRYRAYELVRARVRLLEQGFMLELLEKKYFPEWRERLAAALARPEPPVGYPRAFAVRLRRSYVWLLGIIYLLWLAKVATRGGLPAAAAIHRIPGSVVLLLATLVLVTLVLVAFRHRTPEEG
jgi:uncharacterized membrane protein